MADKISIKEARLRSKMSRSAVAKELGISIETLYRWEVKADRWPPPVSALQKMVKLYQVPVQDLDFF